MNATDDMRAMPPSRDEYVSAFLDVLGELERFINGEPPDDTTEAILERTRHVVRWNLKALQVTP